MTIQILNWRTGAVMATVNAENLIDVDFGGWNLTDADFTDQNCRYANFDGANLTGALFVRGLLGATIFSGTNQSGTDFTDADYSLPPWSLKRIYYNGYSDSRADSTVYRIEALFTDVANNLQYAVWYRQATKGLYVSKEDLGTGIIQIFSLPFSTEAVTHASDTHCVPTILVSGNGLVHIFFGMHAIPLQYLKSTSAGDVASMISLQALPALSGDLTTESTVTYVKGWRVGDDLMVSFRHGSSTDGNEVLCRYDNATDTWSAVHNPLIEGFTGNYLAYVNPPRKHPTTGRLYYGFCWNDGGFGTDRNHDVLILMSDDDGATMFRADASSQTIPITQANDQPAWVIPIGSGLINITSTHWYRDGSDWHPCAANYFDPGAPGSPGFSQYAFFYWDGAAYQKKQVGALINFSIVTDPTVIDFPLSQPVLIWDDVAERMHMLVRVTDWGPGVWDLWSDDLYDTWTLENLSEYDMKSFAPMFDWQQWTNDGVVELFAQRVTESLAEGQPSIGEQPVSALTVILPT
jgi:hypothetical protein